MLLHDNEDSFYMFDCGSERCWDTGVAVHLPAANGGNCLQVLKPVCDSTVACFASELEQDIAALEAEANRDDASYWDCSSADDAVASDTQWLHGSGDDMDHYSPNQSSDSGSEDDTDHEDSVAARIHANARTVAACGRPMQQGAWKGCLKSAWCDREDRHRGLCNHKASIPGPAACATSSVTPCSSRVQQEEVHCELGVAGQHSAGQLSSGDHSLACKHDSPAGDEREVASALTNSCPVDSKHRMQNCTMPSSCALNLAAQHSLAAQVAAATAAGPVKEAFWSNSDTEEEQLITMPAVYQPLVKDLEVPCIGTLLSADSLCDMDEALDVPVPVVQPVVQAGPAVQDVSSITSSECVFNALVKPAISPEAPISMPSSPSCVSEASDMVFDDATAAVAAAEASALAPAQAAVPVAPAQATAVAIAPVIATAGSSNLSVGTFVFPGMLPLEEVHPASCSAQTSAMSKPSAAALVQQYDTLARVSSTGSRLFDSSNADNSAAFVAEAVQPVAAAEEPSAAGRSGAGAAAAPKVPLMQRAPRIKVKPRRADDPPRPLLEPSSPKCKKRMAGRMAAHPSSGHCCTQCGAVSTPVWRAGPAGPKTLCNACGVRYMKVARRK